MKIKIKVKLKTKIKIKHRIKKLLCYIHRLPALHFVRCLSLSLSLSSLLSLCLSLPLFKRVRAAAHTDAVVNRCANGIKGTIH